MAGGDVWRVEVKVRGEGAYLLVGHLLLHRAQAQCLALLGRLDALLLVRVLELAQLAVAHIGGDAPVVLLLVVPRRLLELDLLRVAHGHLMRVGVAVGVGVGVGG